MGQQSPALEIKYGLRDAAIDGRRFGRDDTHACPWGVRHVVTSKLMVVLVVMILVAIACGDSSEGTTTPRAFAISTTTFDGEVCNYEGPSALSPGDIEITVHNLTEETTWFTFARLKTDKTIQNLIDYIKDTPTAPKPDWVQRAWFNDSVSAGGTATAIVVLEPGFYSMVCGTYPEFAYFGAGLTVEE